MTLQKRQHDAKVVSAGPAGGPVRADGLCAVGVQQRGRGHLYAAGHGGQARQAAGAHQVAAQEPGGRAGQEKQAQQRRKK